MKKTELLKIIMGLSIPFLLVGCNNKEQKCDCEVCPQESEESEKENPPSTPAKTYEDGYDEGYDDGYFDGYLDASTDSQDEAYDEGYEDGYETGHSEGYNEGYEAGKKEQEELSHDIRSIHTSLQLQYLNSDNYASVPSGINGSSENSKPLPLEFTLEESPLYKADEITASKIRISEDKNFTSYIEANGENSKFFVSNLKINTLYYYYYYTETTHGNFYSDIKEVFIRNEAPRLLDIDGVTNARDDGGWKIKGEDGKYTKQGVVYRMGRLHASSTKNITAAGIEAFKALGIKTEIDLRHADDGNTVYQSAVDGVAYYNCQMDHKKSYFTDEDNREAVKEVFEIMGQEENYPLMFHCNIGTDRTGFISFMINALAGVEEEYLYRDYLMSNYAHIGGYRDSASISNYISALKGDYQGSSDLSLGAKNYMLDIGVTESEINTIKNMLLGEN